MNLNHTMKILLASLFAAILTSATAQGFLFPTNPPPSVPLAWTASPSPNVNNYFVYYGVGSLQYTNKIAVGNVTSATITLPTWGVKYYFSVTAQAGTLESLFSNEVSTTPKLPLPPLVNPIAVATVQSSPQVNGEFSDVIQFAIARDKSQEFFRLKLESP